MTHPQAHLYAAKPVVTTPVGISFTIPRGWSAVDVSLVHDRNADRTAGDQPDTVRVATTHLEPSAPPIRNAQSPRLDHLVPGASSGPSRDHPDDVLVLVHHRKSVR